ncbi:MAG: cupin domain-containing protein [Candidatus Nanopelagicales bacterium]
MSYPPVRYHGDQGQVGGYLRRAGQPAELDTPGGGAAHFLATTVTTSGEYGLYRWDMGADPTGPAPHFHRTISEAFYVLDGTVRLFGGQEWTEATQGDFLYVPPGGIHAFHNESGAPASMLILFAPGAPREAYFEELARIAATGRQLTAEEWIELFAEHDQYLV